MHKNPTPILDVKNATAGYHETTIIHDISIQVKQGQITAFLGRNGAGKTTLMRYITGLITAKSGTVEIDGQKAPLNVAKRAKLGLGYVPQGRFVFPNLTVEENIAVAAATHKHNPKRAVEQAMSDFEILQPKLKNLAGELSGGQQQILALARALSTQPKILLLDEPSEGVQPSIIDEMAEILLRINKQRSLAILIAEQNLDFCLSLASNVYILSSGKIQAEISTKDLRADTDLQKLHLGI